MAWGWPRDAYPHVPPPARSSPHPLFCLFPTFLSLFPHPEKPHAGWTLSCAHLRYSRANAAASACPAPLGLAKTVPYGIFMTLLPWRSPHVSAQCAFGLRRKIVVLIYTSFVLICCMPWSDQCLFWIQPESKEVGRFLFRFQNRREGRDSWK